MKSSALLIGLIIVACLLITPAMAQQWNGTLGGSGIVQSNWVVGYSSITGGDCYPKFDAVNIEYTAGTTAIVRFDNGYKPTFAGGALNANTVPFNATYGGVEIGNGTWGYQRVFNSAGTEVDGWQYLAFDHWNPGALTGTKSITINANATALWGATGMACYYGGASGTPTGWFRHVISANSLSGSYLQNRDVTTYYNYTATYPNGIGGISGTVSKTVNGVNYPSRAFLIDPTNGAIIASENTVLSTNFNFTTNKTKFYIAVYTPFQTWYNTSTLDATPTPTPTPTQTIPPLDYTLTLNKTAVSYGQQLLATIASTNDPTLANLNGIAYSYISPTSTPNTVNFFEPGSTNNVMNYYLYGATWKGYSVANNTWSITKAAIPNPATLTFYETGTIEVHANVNTKNGDNLDLHIPVTVGSGNFITTTFQAYDGSNYGLLKAVTINIYNLNTQTWTNGTYFNGKASITTPANQLVNAYGIKEGYYPAKYENAVTDGTPYSLVFYQIGAPPETANQTFYVNTFSPSGARVTGALVTIKENGTATTYSKTTSSAGVAQFQLKHSTLYTITASKTGYIGASQSYTTNTGMSDSTNLILTPITTTTVIPTGSWTVSPSYTPTGNMTGFWSPWINLFSQMGAANSELPLLIAGLIIVFCMIIGAGVAGVLGAEVMMGFGAIFCVALGLIPIWVVLAIIVLGFLFYGLKVSK